jgi:hypothetical protein
MTTSAPSAGAFSIIRTFEAGTQSSLRCNLTGAMGASEMQQPPLGKLACSYFNGSISSVIAWSRPVCLSPPMNLIALTVSRGDAIGYVFVVASIVFASFAYFLSRRGFRADAEAKVREAADAAKTAMVAAEKTAASAQKSVAQATGPHVEAIADNTAEVASATSVLQDSISEVNTKLNQMTGNQAPAGAMLAIAVLCLLSALVSFDLISTTVGSEASNAAASAGQ